MRWRNVVSVAVLLVQTLTLGTLLPAIASAADGGIVISALQTAGTTKSTDEFIELANTGAADVDISGWAIQYRAASSSNGSDCTKGWTTKATVASGTIIAGGHYLFAPSMFLAADTSFSAGLAAAGTIRVLDKAKAPMDAVAWGVASCGTGASASAPPAGKSIERHGAHSDNASDFFVQPAPIAHSTSTEFVLGQVATGSNPVPEATVAPATEAAPTASGSQLHLTELLVDPAPPYSDAADEFVELHNAGTDPVEAEGYVVKTGTHTYKLPQSTIAPDGYLVITSADTPISLTNSGGIANLLDPSGVVVDTAGAWGSAIPGASWAYLDGTWLWTLSPTPGAANEYTPVPGTPGADGSTDYAVVELSELLPDPVSPLTDANDEFIEIFNPLSEEVNLAGYVIKVGHDLSSKYIIKDVTVPAGGYAVLKSSITSVALANDGSSVALYTPGGLQLGATVTYGKAPAGASWAHIGSGWSWTADPTPGAENALADIVTAAAAKAAATKAAKAKTTKSSTAKPKVAAKPKATKATKPANKPLLAGSTTPGGRWLLFTLAGLTIAYIIYEFRYDIRNYYFKLRGYPSSSPATVSIPVGRGSNRTRR